MSRPDAALTLAMLFGFEGKKEAKIGGIAISGSGLAAAGFCDAVRHFYAGNFALPDDSNRTLPVGFAADGPVAADPPMIQAALARRNEKGDPVYASRVRKVSDTAEVPALLRNALTAQDNGFAVILLGAPATHLARMLDLLGVPELVVAKVKTLIISEGQQDVAAARKLLAAWPTQVVLCGHEVGEALPYPASSVEHDFAWTPDHPVADAYRAYLPMPYDAPSWDMAAALYAVHPEANFFQLSDPGTIQVGDDGRTSFAPGAAGRHRRLIVDPAKKEQIVKAYVEIASAKPVPRAGPRGGQQKKADVPVTPPPPAKK